MCKRCGNNNCSSCEGNSDSASQVAQLSSQVSSIQTAITNITNSLGFLLNGNPIMIFENANDVALFNLTTGQGSGYLANWGICNGESYLNPNTGKKVLTPNLINRCLVQATGTYAVDDTAGSENINLTVAQLPAHNHGITDSGHTHTINDSGHTHGITDPEHTHAVTTQTITGVTGTTDSEGQHVHGYTYDQALQTGGGGTTYQGATLGPPTGGSNPGTAQGLSGTDSSYLQPAGAHTHTVTVNNFNVSPTIQDAATGISVQDAYTGITNASATTGITTQNTGTGANVDVRQPSYAVIYAMKIY